MSCLDLNKRKRGFSSNCKTDCNKGKARYDMAGVGSTFKVQYLEKTHLGMLRTVSFKGFNFVQAHSNNQDSIYT